MKNDLHAIRRVGLQEIARGKSTTPPSVVLIGLKLPLPNLPKHDESPHEKLLYVKVVGHRTTLKAS